MKDAHRISRSMLKIGTALELLHDLGHDAHSRAAVPVGPPGVGGPSVRSEEKALECVAPRRDLTPLALGWLGDQHVPMPLGLRLDQLARGRAADFFIWVDDECNGQIELESIDYCLQRSKRDDRATLHVVDRVPEPFVSFNVNLARARP